MNRADKIYEKNHKLILIYLMLFFR